MTTPVPTPVLEPVPKPMAAVDLVEQRQRTFERWGPFGLLGIGLVISLATADLLMSPVARTVAWALVVVAFLLQVAWTVTGARHEGPSLPGTLFYAVRWGIAFALTWLNPFFAFYAATGYFGVERLLPRKLPRFGLFATAVTMAGSQSGGLPPQGGLQWVLFGAVLGANVALVTVFGHFAEQERDRSRLQKETIAELERTNARLQLALDENAALHSQLLVQAREAGVADERRRLAAEIHDTIAQGLTGIIAQLQVVTGTSDPAAARVHLDRAADLARHSLGEARRSVQNLAPVALEHDGLPQALEKTVATWAERTGTRAEFTVTGTAEPLHDELDATLLRIAQEALSNTARHASATRVGVTLSYMAGEVTLDVRDDGRGFDPGALPPRSGHGGFGLDGMRARARRLAGSLTVEAEPGQGTAVSARVPLVRHDA
ncbi:sensor histidine kinase [Streptomyces sp. NPDC058001]|uniref:sensor histidine kinase n=1 Tax=Streptomyces sp. NPDC058001 TaxID=3346300 RepID=UPI0036EED47E